MKSEISRDEVRSAIEDKLCAHFGITSSAATDDQVFQATAMVIREIMSRILAAETPRTDRKKVHYLSMEFLMGRSLLKNAFNIGIQDAVQGALEDLGRSATDILDAEPDAGLGNGGLGRLAACYMDSLATMEVPATGYSICYELGMFKQEIKDGSQTEVADDWRIGAESWLVPHSDEMVEVRFGGQVTPWWDNTGHYHAVYSNYTSVYALPRDMLIVGYGGDFVNTLRLWEAHSSNELDMYLFSEGKYVQSLEKRTMAEVITKVLYPADETFEGKKLRLKQQYFFVSATAQTILKEQVKTYGDVRTFAEHNIIQINDTHPTLVIPELLRLLMDEYGLGWDESWNIVSNCVAYTNHTVMSEALELWPQDLMQQLLPRIWEIISEINRRWCDYLVASFGGGDRVGRSMILQNGQVHMANLCLAACYKVNGVSRLHGEILKNSLFRDIYSLQPEKFTYVTNGIDHRRWLAQINPRLHRLICDVLDGDDYLLHPELLADLRTFSTDPSFQQSLLDIKRENKSDFAAWVKKNDGFLINTDAMMDVQVKRLHEYKRQLLCALYIIYLQNSLHNSPNMEFPPRIFAFGAKAAASYKTAKHIIELLCSLQNNLLQDPICRDKLQVYFVPNYRVSVAEILMPAAQISEQISTAGKEASGTGNMKLMMNGAVTIGTLDGANVEMYERLGKENMFLFGLHADEVESLKAKGYNPQNLYDSDPILHEALGRLNSGFGDGKNYSDLASQLIFGGDPYMLLADFDSYRRVHDAMYDQLSHPAEIARMSAVNIAESGYFAADRAVQEYLEKIWNIK
jgi:starch phosphorylase